MLMTRRIHCILVLAQDLLSEIRWRCKKVSAYTAKRVRSVSEGVNTFFLHILSIYMPGRYYDSG